MILALYIFVDDDFESPIYGEPDREELEPELFTALCEAVNDAFEGERPSAGTHEDLEEIRIGWRLQSRIGVTVVCAVTDDVSALELEAYLKDLQRQYMDEVDDPREPEREGVADVVVDVIPPWED